MCKHLFALLLTTLSTLLPNTKAYAYGPFVLPIHDNNVEINGGAWNYSDSCTVTATHSGFDFDGNEGDNVYAAASGVVSQIQNSNCPNVYPNGDPTWGCYVDIKHDVDGDGNYDYTTKYAHLVSGSITVTAGNSVSSNTVIGQLGNSGYSGGAHLHFGVQEYGDCQTLAHTCWLDPYNLNDDNATCCDIPNGCPNEGTSSQHTNFDCDVATDSNYLWASCPPTYDAEVDSSATYDSLISAAQYADLDSLNGYNGRRNAQTGTLEQPNILLTTPEGITHWWSYDTQDANTFTPSSDTHWRDWGRYTTLVTHDYTGGCDGAIVYDEFGGATRAYVVQCEQWTAWLQTNGPSGATTHDPVYCGNPITNVYGKGHRWVQNFQDCYVEYAPSDNGYGKYITPRTRKYTGFAPGEMADGTWSQTYSYWQAPQILDRTV